MSIVMPMGKECKNGSIKALKQRIFITRLRNFNIKEEAVSKGQPLFYAQNVIFCA
jgi:hypothetical protein